MRYKYVLLYKKAYHRSWRVIILGGATGCTQLLQQVVNSTKYLKAM